VVGRLCEEIDEKINSFINHPLEGDWAYLWIDATLARLMDEAEDNVLVFKTFPKDHRVKIHSTNPLERLKGEIERRTDVVGNFPNVEAIMRLIGAHLFKQNGEWTVQRGRYMSLETIAPLSDDPIVRLQAAAA
jgi:transposase-like protein